MTSAKGSSFQTADEPTQGRKYDKAKPRVGLMMKNFPRALLAVSEVTTFGANKYGPSNWLLVEQAFERYGDAEGRHLLLGFLEELDEESEYLHLAHKAWNALAVLELYLREKERGE